MKILSLESLMSLEGNWAHRGDSDAISGERGDLRCEEPEFLLGFGFKVEGEA